VRATRTAQHVLLSKSILLFSIRTSKSEKVVHICFFKPSTICRLVNCIKVQWTVQDSIQHRTGVFRGQAIFLEDFVFN
jgi:hypothetical protein